MNTYSELVKKYGEYAFTGGNDDQSFVDGIFETYFFGQKKYGEEMIGVDTFTTMMFFLLSIRKVERSRTQISFDQSMFKYATGFNGGYTVHKPEFENGGIFIETKYGLGGELNGVFLLDAETMELPYLLHTAVEYGLIEHDLNASNNGIMVVSIVNNEPKVTIELPKQFTIKHLIDDMHANNFNKDMMAEIVATLICFSEIGKGAFERTIHKVPAFNPKKKKKMKRKKRLNGVYNRVFTYSLKNIEDKRQAETSTENLEHKSRSSFTYTPRNTSSHYKKRWVSLEYANTINPDDIIDIQPITKQLKAGELTRDMALVKVWFEFKHNPALEPTTTIKKYKA